MSFFEPVPERQERPARRRQRSWISPPDNELGVTVPIRLLLAKTDTLALAVSNVVAYSTGFGLRLVVKLHHDAKDVDPHRMMMQFRGGPIGGGEDRLRFGIEFSDGRKATNLTPRRPLEEPPPINLWMGGGGGGSSQGWSCAHWVYRLPPEGPITIACAWPHFELPERSVRFDAAPIIEAAMQVEQLWDDDRPYADRTPPTASSGGEQTDLERS